MQLISVLALLALSLVKNLMGAGLMVEALVSEELESEESGAWGMSE